MQCILFKRDLEKAMCLHLNSVKPITLNCIIYVLIFSIPYYYACFNDVLTPASPISIRKTNTHSMPILAHTGVRKEQTAVKTIAPVMMCFPPKMSASAPAGIWENSDP